MDPTFVGGVRYFLQTVGPHKNALIAACKRKYPELNGRGLNVIEIPKSWLGQSWQWGFVVDPGRILLDKPRIRTALSGLQDADFKMLEDNVDAYDPDKNVLFCFICGCDLSVDLL